MPGRRICRKVTEVLHIKLTPGSLKTPAVGERIFRWARPLSCQRPREVFPQKFEPVPVSRCKLLPTEEYTHRHVPTGHKPTDHRMRANRHKIAINIALTRNHTPATHS